MRTYPEHDRLSAVREQSQAIGEFLEWLFDKGYCIATRLDDGRFVPVAWSIKKSLEKFFSIDPDKIEAEKRRILAEIRRETESFEAAAVQAIALTQPLAQEGLF